MSTETTSTHPTGTGPTVTDLTVTDSPNTLTLSATPGRTPARRTGRRIRPSAGALRHAGWLVPAAIVLVLTLWPNDWLPFPPTASVGAAGSAPDGVHWFGTDSAGMDVFSRTIASFRIDVLLGILVAVLTTVISGAVGVLVGFFEGERSVTGTITRLIGRGLDLFQAIPIMAAALVAVVAFGLSIPSLVISLAVVLSPAQIRLVRTEVLRVRELGYIDAATIAGYGRFRIAVSRVLPNSVWPLVENLPLIFATSIMILAALGFLGVGLQPPTPEWGAMIAGGSSDAAVGRWWTALFPSAALIGTVLATLSVRDALVVSVANRRATGRG
ncbi:ABC transporter permease [Herbiconiux moechotypicola]|uniref:ABC transporter permease n=1 Tax=Herbiconiux moechotypicola TaxID=637393 RepID=A0ABN3DQ24_9MICO|nr:ABC transporter permease [Herbiconiux moechotypicola]MCS5731680.1 ABC transporter permease [Herbiconiux moechotypicola]